MTKLDLEAAALHLQHAARLLQASGAWQQFDSADALQAFDSLQQLLSSVDALMREACK
jgi:hypothetical protein